ncbi:MAG: hypothetical protein V1876_03500, partial [Candidatus Peregrinibacteria bacterium]
RITEQQLAKEQRLFRSVLYGAARAEDAPLNEVRYDKQGNPWIKTEEDSWRSTAAGFEQTTWSDALMNSSGELDPRKGIFETKRVATSDLVPYLVQAYRTLKCRSAQACKAVELSLTQEAPDPQEIVVIVPGCTQETKQTFVGCHLAAGESKSPEQADLLTYCRLVLNDLVAREKDLLKTATEYDASYRSLLQFSGEFDAFLQEFRWPMASTIRKAVQMIGSLHRIPCFIGSCDESPPPDQQ